MRKMVFVSIIVLLASMPSRAELLQVDLSIFGMD